MNECLRVLENNGLLLKSDPKLPSVSTLIAGEPVRGSWWGHPAGRAVYAAIGELEENPDVLLVKLVAGKDTFVHRQLWSEVYALATSDGPWQILGLPAAARALCEKVEAAGILEASGTAAKELETRLLVYAEQFHTTGGVHKKRLESWEHWAGRKAFNPAPVDFGEAKSILEARLPGARFPWK
jgi:hypothetical protein